MKKFADLIGTAVIAGGIAIAAPAIGQESDSNPPELICDIGPIVRAYGMTPWLVYSCVDQRTVVIISAPSNPANPFVFMLFPGEDGYRLHGEGTGSADMTAAAFEELETLSEEDIAALIEQTNQR
jgi:hypothetical protein